MQDLYNDLTELCGTLERETGEANDKIRKAGGKLSAGDLEYVDKLTHAIKSIKTTLAMMDSGRSHDSYPRDYSGTHENNYNSNYNRSYDYGTSYDMSHKRDSMGRYSRDNGSLIHELRELMEQAPNEEARREFQRFIQKMEAM